MPHPLSEASTGLRRSERQTHRREPRWSGAESTDREPRMLVAICYCCRMEPIEETERPNPSVVIYQNPDYVAGILQEAEVDKRRRTER